MMATRIWLSELRKTQGFSQRQVSELAGMNRAAYAHIESGSRNPSVRTAQAIAQALKFDWCIFFKQ